VAGGLAGCSGALGGDNEEDDIRDTDNDGVIDSEDYAPRDPEIQREEQVKGDTPQESTSDSSNNSNMNANFSDDYERSEITELRAVNEPLDRWEIENNIDGRSLKGEGGNSSPGPGARVVYDPTQYEWSGNREISVEYRTDTSLSKRHAQLLFYDGVVEWQVAATEALDVFRLRWGYKGDGAVQNVDKRMESGTVHELSVRIEGSRITASFDGEDLIEYTHFEEIGPGTVGFGVGDGRRTWYDKLRVASL
jgi:hypothetical protein